MKFILSFCSAFFVTTALFSQNQFGIFAGPQVTTAKYSVLNVNQKTNNKYGFQAGVTMKVPFESNLYFAPEAFYSLKGYKVAFTTFAYPPDATATDNNTTIHTFELAALLQVDLGSKPSHFYIKAGPSLDFQLIGKETFNLNTGGSVSRNMKWGPAEYGHFSANLLTRFGYETKSGFMIFAQHTLGPASINNADFGPRIRHRAYGLSIGKYINRKKILIDTRNKE
ncbi:MAG: porin family protein [Chitinophagaceae bacterium]